MPALLMPLQLLRGAAVMCKAPPGCLLLLLLPLLLFGCCCSCWYGARLCLLLR
jgi:hypothetical protein